MVVYDLQYGSLSDAVHGLCLFVVIHKYELSSLYVHKVTAGYHAAVVSVGVKHGEIAVSLFRHYLFYVIDISVLAEGHDIVLFHKISDGGALIYEP